MAADVRPSGSNAGGEDDPWGSAPAWLLRGGGRMDDEPPF